MQGCHLLYWSSKGSLLPITCHLFVMSPAACHLALTEAPDPDLVLTILTQALILTPLTQAWFSTLCGHR